MCIIHICVYMYYTHMTRGGESLRDFEARSRHRRDDENDYDYESYEERRDRHAANDRLLEKRQKKTININKYYEFEADMLQNVSQIIDKIRESEPTIQNYFMRSYNKANNTEDDVRDKVNNCVKFTNLLLDLIKLVKKNPTNKNPTNNCDNILKVTLLNNKNDIPYHHRMPSDIRKNIPNSALGFYYEDYAKQVDILHLVYAGDNESTNPNKDSTKPKLGKITVSQFYKHLESYLLHGKKFYTNATDSSSELIEGLILFFLGLVYTRAFIKGYSMAYYEYNIDFYEEMMNEGGLRGNKSDSLFSIINSKNNTFTQRVTQGINKIINPKQPELNIIHQLINTIKESYASFALHILNYMHHYTFAFSSANDNNIKNNNIKKYWNNDFNKVFIRHDQLIIRDFDGKPAQDNNPSSMDLSDRIMPIMKSIEEPTRNIISMCHKQPAVDTTSLENNNNSYVNGGKSRRRRSLSKRKTVHGRKTISKRRSRK